MIFPRPLQEEFFAGTYESSLTAEGTLLDFYKANQAGSRELQLQSDLLLAREEYTLAVTETGIRLTFSTEDGKYRAMTSLYMLVKAQGSVLKQCFVHDKPEFNRRGYMLDISRGRMPKPETIKTLIDLLSLLKYNEFQLYMESFCFKYSAYPEYTKDFDCLTPEDIEELDAYCSERFIDLVPNQNCFGHMNHWMSKKELEHLELSDGVTKSGTINPLLPETYEFVDNLFGSLLPHFSSEYVNIGLDEAFGLGKFQIEEYCKQKGKDTVFMDWLEKMTDLTENKYGKKSMFWADMIYNYENAYKRIPRNSIALEWGYELIQSQVMAEHCMTFKNKGVTFYVCPSCNTHLTFTGRFDVTSFNLRTAGEVGRKYGAEGYLVTDWGMPSGGHPHSGVWSFLPAALGGQYAWQVGDEQNGENFKAHYIRGAQKFVNDYVFDGVNIAEYIYRAGNYYLLEPERVHVGTMLGEISCYDLDVTKYPPDVAINEYPLYFDLMNTPYDFYFDNIVDYMTKIIDELKEIDFDTIYKREMLMNCKMVVLGAGLCKVRIHQTISKAEHQKLDCLIDEIRDEFCTLWNYRNYEKGKERYLDILSRMQTQLKTRAK